MLRNENFSDVPPPPPPSLPSVCRFDWLGRSVILLRHRAQRLQPLFTELQHIPLLIQGAVKNCKANLLNCSYLEDEEINFQVLS